MEFSEDYIGDEEDWINFFFLEGKDILEFVFLEYWIVEGIKFIFLFLRFGFEYLCVKRNLF